MQPLSRPHQIIVFETTCQIGEELSAAVVTKTEDFQAMALDCEAVVLTELGDDRFDRAGGKRDHIPAPGADKVMPVARFADDIGRMAV